MTIRDQPHPSVPLLVGGSRMPRLEDVVVLLPGITGSILRHNGKDVWAPTASGFLNALLTFGGDIQRLRLENDSEDMIDLGDGVTVGGLMPTAHLVPGLWKIDGYTETVDALRALFSNVKMGRNFFEFAYDWRRSNRFTAKVLRARTEEWLQKWRTAPDGNPDAKLILVAHSMGGLASRYFLEVLEGWRDTRALVTFGTPFRGSLNALDFLANGYRKVLGLLDITDLLRSFTSTYQLLPTYRCCSFGSGPLAYLDAGRIPGLDPAKVASALQFHKEIADKVAEHAKLPEYVEAGYRIYPIVGTHQPTLESARLLPDAREVELLADYVGQDWDGDGTVPRVSATPPEWKDASGAMFTATRHSSLQVTRAVLEHLDGILTALYMKDAVLRRGAATPRSAPAIQLGLSVDDVFEAGEPIVVRVRPNRDPPALFAVIQEASTGRVVAESELGGDMRAEVPPLAAGLYRITVGGNQSVEPVADVFEVLPRMSAAHRAPAGASARTTARPIEWTTDFAVVDATDVPAIRSAVATPTARYIVLRRPAGYLYALRPAEIPEAWLNLRTLETEDGVPGPLREFTASDVRFGNMADEPVPGPGAAPSSERVVLVSDRGEPLRVGAEAPSHLAMARPRGAIPPSSAGPPGDAPRVKGSAQGDGAQIPVEPQREGTSIARYPSLGLKGSVKPRVSVQVSVDLSLRRQDETDTTGVNLQLETGWESVPVRVFVSAPDLVFDGDTNEGIVTVRNGQPSIPWKTNARVADDLGGRDKIVIRAAFTYEGRSCGSAKRAFAVANVTEHPATTTATAQPTPPSLPPPTLPPIPTIPPLDAPLGHTAGRALVRREGPRPKLTIRMMRIDDAAGTFQWHIEVPDEARGIPGLPKRLNDIVSLGTTAPAFVAKLFENCEQLPPGGHVPFFQGLGDDLYVRTPGCFKQAYWTLVNRYGPDFPIQFVSDDPYIPWELMRPSTSGAPADFLGMNHPVGRWFCDYEGSLRPSIPPGRVLTIAPNYKNRPQLASLPWAQAESAAILKELPNEARREAGAIDGMLALLVDASAADVSLIHFAGHGTCAVTDTKFALLYLEDAELRVFEVRRLETKLGEHRHPLVFLNACQVARSGLNLGVLGGFAEALMNREFGGLVAPLWAVYDDQAATVTSDFIGSVVKNHGDFASALRDIRKNHGAKSATFLSYIYYGDVMARFE